MDPSAATPVGWSEADRLAALRRYDILDTPAEPEFDAIVALVRTICQTPIALVSLVDSDRQWFKARVGTAAAQTGIDTSVCALAIRQRGLFVIADLAADPRTAGMSLVTDDPRIRFYAGMPLVDRQGLPLGSLCAIDTVSRAGGLASEQALALEALARQTVILIESRTALLDRERALVEQERKTAALARDAAAHRIGRDRLELAMRAAKLGGFEYLPQTDELDWDDRCRALFGVSPGVPVSYEGTFVAGLHPDDRAATMAAVTAALDPAGTGTYEMEYRTIGLEDGIERHIVALGLATFEDGAATRLIGTVQDVTADRRARAALRETEERLRLAGRATNDAVWDWDLVRDSVLWNEALTAAYGHPLGSVRPNGAWWLDHIHPDDRARIDRSIHRVIEGTDSDWTDEYRFRRADGSHADVRDRGYVIRDAEGRAIRMVGALLDQTDRKRIEQNLRERNESLALSVSERTEELDKLWSTSPDLLVVLDLEGVVRRVNPAWATILGREPRELVGRRIETLALPEDAALTRQALAPCAGLLPTFENRYRHRNGKIHWFSWVAAPTGGQIYATGRHITAEKEAAEALRIAEEQLRQSQKVEAIGQLTGGVAHDFNNLLTVIRGSVDLLRRTDLSAERRGRYIDAIADTADRAARLTSQLLAFARRTALKPETFDVGDSIRGLHDMIHTLTGSLIVLEIDVADEPCLVDADPNQFDTAIINMAVNARDAMDREGRLRIAVRPVDVMPAIRSHPAVRGAFVAVEIADTGGGIPLDRLDHIFEPFYTTKQVGEGTGLGLSQVFGFAKQSGGEIHVDSAPGEGATFTLYLPRIDGTAASAGSTKAAAGPLPPGACILVVEDNPEVGSFAVQALEELGYHTVLATSGVDALTRLAEPANGFDFVFSDVVMPGMTGIELGQRIRTLYPRLPVILTSGYSDVLAREGTHGFDLLHKPYSIAELAGALSNTVRG